jgi:hypothetical protein
MMLRTGAYLCQPLRCISHLKCKTHRCMPLPSFCHRHSPLAISLPIHRRLGLPPGLQEDRRTVISRSCSTFFFFFFFLGTALSAVVLRLFREVASCLWLDPASNFFAFSDFRFRFRIL